MEISHLVRGLGEDVAPAAVWRSSSENVGGFRQLCVPDGTGTGRRAEVIEDPLCAALPETRITHRVRSSLEQDGFSKWEL